MSTSHNGMYAKGILGIRKNRVVRGLFSPHLPRADIARKMRESPRPLARSVPRPVLRGCGRPLGGVAHPETESRGRTGPSKVKDGVWRDGSFKNFGAKSGPSTTGGHRSPVQQFILL